MYLTSRYLQYKFQNSVKFLIKFWNSIHNPGRNPGKFHDFYRDRDSKKRLILAGTGISPGSRSIPGDIWYSNDLYDILLEIFWILQRKKNFADCLCGSQDMVPQRRKICGKFLGKFKEALFLWQFFDILNVNNLFYNGLKHLNRVWVTTLAFHLWNRVKIRSKLQIQRFLDYWCTKFR